MILDDDDDETQQNLQRKFFWYEDETSALIRIYKKYKDSYDNYAIKKQFWTIIANVLDKEGFPGRDADKCKDKWRSLMHAYENYLNQSNKNFYYGQALDDVFNVERKKFLKDHNESEVIVLDNIGRYYLQLILYIPYSSSSCSIK